MAGKKKSKKKSGNTENIAIKVREQNKTLISGQYQKYLLPAVILITLIVYFPSLKNDFIINWDDNGYILDYKPIQSINAENLKIIFTEFYKGNYHPVTTLFYAIEYSLVGKSPFLFHLNNLILHLINVLLVFMFIRRLGGKRTAAAFCALLFGIHPMHVESVAWISERKDVLYTCFFLLSLITYQSFVSGKNKKWLFYVVSVLLFLFSLFSKSAAVCLPVVLLLIDYYKGRKFNLKCITEKAPYFILALAFGIIAVMSQDETGAIQNLTPLYSLFHRVFIVSYALTIYILKFFVPVKLTAMYSYPQLAGGQLPVWYYLSGGFVLFIIVLFVIYLRKNKVAVFGVLFFLVTIALVLQIIPVGGAVLAERYTYVPYIGLLFIFGVAYNNISEGRKKLYVKLRPALRLVVVAYIIGFSYLTFERIGVWKNGGALFSDVIAKDPSIPFAYGNRAFYYKENEMWDKALKDYDVAVKLNPEEKGIFANRAAALYQLGRYEEAVSDFKQALKRKNDDADALLGIANTYSSLKKYRDAIPYYNGYLALKTDNSKAWLWRAVAYFYEKQVDSTMADANMCLNLDPLNDEGYYWKGISYYEKGDFKTAVELLDKSIELNPGRGEVYSWRGLSKQNMKLFREAVADYDLALKYSPSDAAAYINRGVSNYELKKYKEALNDIESAIKLGYPVNPDFHKMLQSKVTR